MAVAEQIIEAGLASVEDAPHAGFAIRNANEAQGADPFVRNPGTLLVVIDKPIFFSHARQRITIRNDQDTS